MSKTKKNYVFVFLCLKQKRICLCVLVMKIKSSLPRVGRVARSAGRVFFSTPSVLSSFGLVPLCYGDSLKLMSKTQNQYVFMFLCQKLKDYVFMFLCLKLKEICLYVLMSENKKAPLHYVAALNIFDGISVNPVLEYNGHFVRVKLNILNNKRLGL